MMATEPSALHEFWSFNLGHLLTLLVMAFGFIWWFVKYDRQLTSTVLGLTTLTQTTETLRRYVEQMDNHGTRASQLNINSELLQIKMHATKIEELEKMYREMNPKVTRIEYMLENIVANTDISGKRGAREKRESGENA
jgi:hypothetical protein